MTTIVEDENDLTVIHWDLMTDHELADTIEGLARDLPNVPMVSGILSEIRHRLMRSGGPNREISVAIKNPIRCGPRRSGDQSCSSTAPNATSKSSRSKGGR